MYNDKLIQINDSGIVIRYYYAPFLNSKTIPYSEIEKAEVLSAKLTTGQWRIWGMGLLPVWFAMDWKRPYRDVIFYVNILGAALKAGFTCESPEEVIKELKKQGVEIDDKR